MAKCISTLVIPTGAEAREAGVAFSYGDVAERCRSGAQPAAAQMDVFISLLTGRKDEAKEREQKTNVFRATELKSGPVGSVFVRRVNQMIKEKKPTGSKNLTSWPQAKEPTGWKTKPKVVPVRVSHKNQEEKPSPKDCNKPLSVSSATCRKAFSRVCRRRASGAIANSNDEFESVTRSRASW